MDKKKQELKVQLNDALLKLQEAKDTATELDHANCLDIDMDDLDDLITDLENLCNKADGTDELDETE